MKINKELIGHFVNYNYDFNRGYLEDDELNVIQSKISTLENNLCELRKQKKARIFEILDLCGIKKGLRFSDQHGETFEIQKIQNSSADYDNSGDFYVFVLHVNKNGKALKTKDGVFSLATTLKIIELSNSAYYVD